MRVTEMEAFVVDKESGSGEGSKSRSPGMLGKERTQPCYNSLELESVVNLKC